MITPEFLQVSDLHVEFAVREGVRHTTLRAVDGLDLTLERGEALGIVGESGCGKSTVARALVGLVQPCSGTIRLDGLNLSSKRDARTRRRIQMVFQDPGSSLNPLRTVGSILCELLRAHAIVPPRAERERAAQLMTMVGLPARLLDVRPTRLSGGQRQRVGIARALAVEPELLIADEAVAALDVSVQAAILNLFADLQARLGLSMIFISHDLGAVGALCDRVTVMYLGKAVENTNVEALFDQPTHPYTKALLDATPQLASVLPPGTGTLRGEPPSPLRIPPGCRFHPRCPIARDICRSVEPMLASSSSPGPDRDQRACHFPLDPTNTHISGGRRERNCQ